MHNKKVLLVIGGAILLTIGGVSVFLTNKSEEIAPGPEFNLEEETPTQDVDVSSNKEELSSILDENGLDIKANYNTHTHGHEEEKEFELTLSKTKHSNYIFQEPEIVGTLLHSNEINTFGKNVIHSYGNHSLVQNANRQLFLVNHTTKAFELISPNIRNYKILSESETIFSVQTGYNLFSLFYIDLDNSKPVNNVFFDFGNTPFLNTYHISDTHFFFKQDAVFSAFPYSIEDKKLSLHYGAPDISIPINSLFINNDNEIFGYRDNTIFRFIETEPNKFNRYIGNLPSITHEGMNYFILNSSLSPSLEKEFYIANFNKESEFGFVFYNNKHLYGLSGLQTQWLDDRYILDLSENKSIILYDTINDEYKEIIGGVGSVSLDRTNSKIFITSYYNENLYSISFEKK